MRRGLRLVALAVGLALATVAGSEPLTLDAHALRQLAFTAVKAGYAEDALTYTDALLQRDAEDTTALAIRSQALRALGRLGEAKRAAAEAWASAESDPGRFGAAMAMAQVLSSGGKRGAAQWWLRRAADNAPNGRAKAVARRDFAYVKSRNPWDIQINANAAPNSNVNNGSRQDRLTLAGLPFEFEIPEGSQALSGYEAGLGLRATYRLSPTGPDRQTKVIFGALGQIVLLSAESRSRAPDVTGADFAYAAVEGGVHHRRKLGELDLSAAATVGRNWYGSMPLSDYVRLEAGAEHRLGKTDLLSVGVAADKVLRTDSPAQSSDRIELRLGYGRRLASGNQVNFGLSAGRAVSDSREIGNEALGLSLGWTRVKPVAGLGLSAELVAENKVFSASRYVAGGREDLRLTASVSVQFEDIDYMGFSPTLDIRATRNRSNAALYDTQDFGVTFGVRSSF